MIKSKVVFTIAVTLLILAHIPVKASSDGNRGKAIEDMWRDVNRSLLSKKRAYQRGGKAVLSDKESPDSNTNSKNENKKDVKKRYRVDVKNGSERMVFTMPLPPYEGKNQILSMANALMMMEKFMVSENDKEIVKNRSMEMAQWIDGIKMEKINKIIKDTNLGTLRHVANFNASAGYNAMLYELNNKSEKSYTPSARTGYYMLSIPGTITAGGSGYILQLKPTTNEVASN